MTDFEIDSMTFADYVGADFIGRVGYVGDALNYFSEHGLERLPPKTAVELAWQYSDQGAALGAIHPQNSAKDVRTDAHRRSQEEWEFARAAGLNISPKQDLLSYEQTEEAEDRVFMAYCIECCPNLHTILTSQAATGIDLGVVTPEVGREISWADIIRHVFRVLEFDRVGTTIGPDDQVQALNAFSPYGYLLVESPILDQPVRLPIIHRDDFLLAASVFDEPKLADLVTTEELLVTYAPRKVLSGGLSGEPSHVLHYVMTPQGTLGRYYAKDNEVHMSRPNPALLLGQFVYDGEIRVQVNPEPEI